MTQTPTPTPAGRFPAEGIDAFEDRFIAAWNSHDPQRLIDLVQPDVVWEDPFVEGGRLVGHEALGDWLRSVWRGMPDLTSESVGAVHVAQDGTSAMGAWRGTGTMTGRLEPPGFAPTNGRVEMTGVDTHWFGADGRLVRVVTVSDAMSVGRQIGAAPLPGSIAERVGVLLQRLAAVRLRRAHR